jgi:hypothetical protein
MDMLQRYNVHTVYVAVLPLVIRWRCTVQVLQPPDDI